MQRIITPLRRLKFNKKDSWIKKLTKIGLILALIVFLFVIGTFIYFYKDLPSPDGLTDRQVAESTKIYDRTGTHLLYDIHGEEKRTLIPYSEMPDTIKYATIALEDQDFYNHHGIKISSIIRAAIKDILHRGVAQGGSTITQQFVKKSMLSDEKTFTRKIKEVILSIELETKYSKNEILEMYLNQIPYGSNAYGIEAAAQTFFEKHARELTLDEATLLASLPQAPSYYSPLGSHPEDLKARQELALKQMFNLGYITEEQMNEAKAVDVLAKVSSVKENISAPHFVMYVKEYLEKNYGNQALEQGGLKVYTTLDWDKQQIAEKVVREGAEANLEKYNAENAALVAIDPKTGQILSMVGSKDYFDKSIDGQVNVAIRERQPGSSFKPFVYLNAFTKGYTPETQLWDVDTDFETDDGEEYNPQNYDGENRGLLKMKEALAMSLNVPAVKTLYLAGVNSSVDLAKSLGITTLNYPDRYGLSLVLGGGEVMLLDHTNAFATLAAGGLFREKTAILKIEGADGKILDEYKENEGERVVEEKYVAMLDYILSTNELRASVFGENNKLAFSDRPVAAKTGTTNEWRDGWTMGYTPSLAVGVWTGNNNNSKMAEGADGSYVATPIWRNFMDEALKNQTIEKFPDYDKEEDTPEKDILKGDLKIKDELKVCEIPGKKNKYCLANDACPDKLTDKKKFFNAHTILYYVNKDDPRGDAPEDPEDDPQYKNWEKAVQKWADKEGYEVDDVPEDKCKADDFDKYKPEVKISASSSGKSINIKIEGSAGFGVDKNTLYVDDKEVSSKSDESFSYTYTATDDQNGKKLEIKVILKDDTGNSVSDSTTITPSF